MNFPTQESHSEVRTCPRLLPLSNNSLSSSYLFLIPSTVKQDFPSSSSSSRVFWVCFYTVIPLISLGTAFFLGFILQGYWVKLFCITSQLSWKTLLASCICILGFSFFKERRFISTSRDLALSATKLWCEINGRVI